jgi:hypothetical protein
LGVAGAPPQASPSNAAWKSLWEDYFGNRQLCFWKTLISKTLLLENMKIQNVAGAKD